MQLSHHEMDYLDVLSLQRNIEKEPYQANPVLRLLFQFYQLNNNFFLNHNLWIITISVIFKNNIIVDETSLIDINVNSPIIGMDPNSAINPFADCLQLRDLLLET